jgi:hypothetical protein
VPRSGHSTALFAYECQSFLDNLIAGLGEIGAWNDLSTTSTSFETVRDLLTFRDAYRKRKPENDNSSIVEISGLPSPCALRLRSAKRPNPGLLRMQF